MCKDKGWNVRRSDVRDERWHHTSASDTELSIITSPSKTSNNQDTMNAQDMRTSLNKLCQNPAGACKHDQAYVCTCAVLRGPDIMPSIAIKPEGSVRNEEFQGKGSSLHQAIKLHANQTMNMKRHRLEVT